MSAAYLLSVTNLRTRETKFFVFSEATPTMEQYKIIGVVYKSDVEKSYEGNLKHLQHVVTEVLAPFGEWTKLDVGYYNKDGEWIWRS